MSIPLHQEAPPGKSLRDLGLEAFWFSIHTLLAVLLLVLTLAGMTLTQPDPETYAPKILGTVLAFLVPLLGGYLIARIQQNYTARYVWISGILFFSVLCVWVLDLPTGSGLCEHCDATQKLWRTFFDITHGSGLLGGDGLLLGTWLPLCLIAYAIGASFALED